MDEHRSHGLTAKSGALILLMCILLSATAFVSSLMPYISHKSLTAPCTSRSTATVVEAEEPVLEGNYYYGPIVEYYHSERGRLVHSAAVSVEKSRMKWQVGDTVNIAYDPNSPGDIYITDDDHIVKSYKQSLIMSIIMVSVGFILCVIGIIRTIRGTDPGLYERRFIKTPDGRSFEEWAEEMQKKVEESKQSADEQENGDGEE